MSGSDLFDFATGGAAMLPMVGSFGDGLAERRPIGGASGAGAVEQPRPAAHPPLESFPSLGACGDCGQPQYHSPAGPVCANGHGGAATIPFQHPEVPLPNVTIGGPPAPQAVPLPQQPAPIPPAAIPLAVTPPPPLARPQPTTGLASGVQPQVSAQPIVTPQVPAQWLATQPPAPEQARGPSSPLAEWNTLAPAARSGLVSWLGSPYQPQEMQVAARVLASLAVGEDASTVDLAGALELLRAVQEAVSRVVVKIGG